MSSGKSKLKQDKTTYLFEWPNSVTLTLTRQGFGAAGTLIHCQWECNVVQTLWKTVWQFLTKLNIFFPYNSAMMLLDIYPEKLET